MRRGLLGLVVACLAIVGLSVGAQAATTAITPGTAFTLSVPAGSGSTASYTFTGQAGKRVVVQGYDEAVSSPLLLQLSRSGVGLGDPLPFGPYAEFGVLPTTGTWTLTATNQTSSEVTGTATLTLVVPDVTAPLTLGTPVTRTFSPAGQNTNLTFNATAGQKLGLRFTAVDLTNRSRERKFLAVTLVPPNGSPAGTAQISQPGLNTYALDVTGTWTIRIDPVLDTTGTATLTASILTDRVVTPVLGKPTSVSLPGDGTGVRFTVDAKVGQRLTFGVTAADISSVQQPLGYSVALRILDPQGRPWKSPLITELNGGPQYIESPQVFDVAGRYTVVFDPAGDTAASITFVPNLVSDVVSATKLGAQSSFKVTVPGQNQVLTFAGTQGQKVVATLDSVRLTAGGDGGSADSAGVGVTLYSPDGQTVASGPFLETTLTASGTWKLVVDPNSDTVGSGKVTIRKQVVTTSSLTLGSRVTTPTIAPGDVMRYRFTAVAGRRVGLDVRTVALDGSGTADVRLLRPDGTEFWIGQIYAVQFIDTPALDVRGTWTLEIDPPSETSGKVSLIVDQPVDVTGAIALDKAVTATLKQAGQQGRYTFTGVAGRFPAVDSTAKTWKTQPDGQPAKAQFRLIAPDGTDYAPFTTPQPYPNPDSTSTRALLEQYTAGSSDGSLNAGGTWTLVVDPEANATGSETFTLRLLTTPPYH